MNRRRLLWAACGGMFVFGIVLAILGALFGLPGMRERLSVDLAQQGDIFFALFLGVFVSTVLTGPVIDSFGNKMVMTASAFVTAIALGGLVFVHSFIAAVAVAFLLGFAGSGMNTAANVLVADIYPENRGAMLNLVGTFYGVGAMFVPLLASTITSITALLWIAASTSALATAAYALLTFPQPREAVGFSLFGSIRAATIPGVMLLALILVCQSGNEASVGGWTSTYLDSLGATSRVATWVLAGYWAAMMSGRILATKIVEAISKERLVLVSGIGSVIGCGTLIAARSVPVLAIGAVIAGLSFAAVYPTVLAIAGDRYRHNAGTIFGFLFATGLIGGMCFPFAIGHIASHVAVRAAMVVPVIGALAIVALTVTLMRRTID